MDRNTKPGIEYWKIISAFNKEGIFKDYQKRLIKNNIRFFISKLLESLPESTPNRGCLESKLDSFKCKFCTDSSEVSVFSTPELALNVQNLLMWPENRGPLRSPGNPVTNEFEASSVDLFFFFFVLFLIFVDEFAGLVELVELISVVAATSSSSDQSYQKSDY